MKFNVNIEKTVETVLYILNRVDACDWHKLSKILYFADKSHLTEYGRPITGDEYIAMKNGPVPSYVYDIIKYLKGEKPYLLVPASINTALQVIHPYYVKGIREADLDFLSESDIEHITLSIKENAGLDFNQLTLKSHDEAWLTSNRDSSIDIIKIAVSGGANTEMIEYINSRVYDLQHFCA